MQFCWVLTTILKPKFFIDENFASFQVFDFELSDDEMKKILALNKNHRTNTEDM